MARIFTIGELAGLYSLPMWKLRRAADSVHGVQRAGLYRLIPAGRLHALESELRRRGWLPGGAIQ